MGTKLQHYCLKWNNYQSHVAEIFIQLLHAESMVDVTLCVEGQKIYAHRIVLSACSSYFQEILSNTEDAHPIVILSEMSSEDIKSIVEFVYRGELNVNADRFSSVLRAAEELRIRGLMEVSSHLPSLHEEHLGETASEENVGQNLGVIHMEHHPVDLFMGAAGNVILPEASVEETQITVQQDPKEVLVIAEKSEEEDKRRKRRKETNKRDYSEAMLAAALDDLKAGHSLVETAATHHIPRSTLYVRARAQGIPMTITRQEHSGERVQAAVRAVTDGASLQQASELYKIPKTVLWRRVHKEGGSYTMSRRSRLNQTYGLEKKQAAVRALERGENLSKVSHQYQIPKTTLFREKARLVEAGRLPWTCLRRREQDADGYKQHRLSEAVAACKEGKMSQAVASLTFQVPKTTIWRRLQKGLRPSIKQQADNEVDTAVAQLQEQDEFSFQEVSPQIPVTYIDENDFPEASLIILTTDDTNTISLPDGGQLLESAPADSAVTEEHAVISYSTENKQAT